MRFLLLVLCVLSSGCANPPEIGKMDWNISINVTVPLPGQTTTKK